MSFDKTIILLSSIRVHFIEVKLNSPPGRTTTFKTTPLGHDSIIIYWSLSFHIAFVELSNQTYYLIVMQKIHNQTSIIEKNNKFI